MVSHETRSFMESCGWQSFAQTHGLKEKKGSPPWKMTKRTVGEIVGIPGSRGILVATNGIDCYIERLGNDLFYGHLAWFVQEKPDPEISDLVKKARTNEGLENMKEFKAKQLLEMMEY